MIRIVAIAVILLFVFGQLTRLRPSGRDRQLQALRKAATSAGLSVRFWTARNSGYNQRQLPESGYLYQLPCQKGFAHQAIWALWLESGGGVLALAGQPPDLARDWLDAFRLRFPDGWALLECTESGVGLLWQERGEPDDVQKIADALNRLRQNLDALPG